MQPTVRLGRDTIQSRTPPFFETPRAAGPVLASTVEPVPTTLAARKPLSGDEFEILDMEPPGESWLFQGGSRVRCRMKTFPGGERGLVAFESVEPAGARPLDDQIVKSRGKSAGNESRFASRIRTRTTGIRFLPMRLKDLIETASSNQPLSSADVERVAREMGMAIPELMDLFARTVATSYLRGDYSFGDADMAMNQLFGFAHVETRLGLSEFAWQVFGAFDEGEYIHEGLSTDEQGEALTRKILRGIGSLNSV